MAKFTQVVVHFETSDGEARRAIVTPGPRVQAIFLDGSHERLSPKVEPIKKPPPPAVVRLEDENGQIAAMEDVDGPQVCYLVGNQLFCW